MRAGLALCVMSRVFAQAGLAKECFVSKVANNKRKPEEVMRELLRELGRIQALGRSCQALLKDEMSRSELKRSEGLSEYQLKRPARA